MALMVKENKGIAGPLKVLPDLKGDKGDPGQLDLKVQLELKVSKANKRSSWTWR